MGRAGQGRGNGSRSAAAAVFPIEGIRIADVDRGDHFPFLRIAEDQAVSRQVFAVDIVLENGPIFFFIQAFQGRDEVDEVRNTRQIDAEKAGREIIDSDEDTAYVFGIRHFNEGFISPLPFSGHFGRQDRIAA